MKSRDIAKNHANWRKLKTLRQGIVFGRFRLISHDRRKKKESRKRSRIGGNLPKDSSRKEKKRSKCRYDQAHSPSWTSGFGANQTSISGQKKGAKETGERS